MTPAKQIDSCLDDPYVVKRMEASRAGTKFPLDPKPVTGS